jgi:hypothetical protein
MDTETLFRVGVGLRFGSQIGQGVTALSDANFVHKAKDYEAAGYERQASEERAAAQRQAIEQRKATDLVISKQIAGAAASGSAVSSPTILDLIGDTAQEGEYRALADMYGGEARARSLQDRANMSRAEGSAAETRGRNKFAGSIVEALSTKAGSEYRFS